MRLHISVLFNIDGIETREDHPDGTRSPRTGDYEHSHSILVVRSIFR